MGINSVNNFGPLTSMSSVQSSAVGQIQQEGNVSGNPADPEQSNSVAVNTTNIQDTTNSKDQKQPAKSSLQNVTDKLNDFMESINTDLRVQLHTKTDELMVQIVDRKTHKVLREAPPHEYLDLVAKIRECFSAILDKKI